MSKVEELINELCPDGIEYTPLWKVTIWDKKFNSVEREKQSQIIIYPYLLATDLFKLEQENGDVFLLSTGEQTGWTTEELAGDNLCEGEVVTIPWGKSRPVKEVIKYYNGMFVTADNRIATSSDTEILLNKFLYHWMLNEGATIDKFYRGSGIKHPSMNDVLNMQIPLPPLPVQREIVRILDNFTELTAELTARKKQYEYYRAQLISSSTSTVVKLKEVANVYLGLTYTPTYVDNGVTFISAQNTSSDFLDLSKVKYISEDEYTKSTFNAKPQKGDILFTRVGSNLGHPVIVQTEIPLCIFVSLGFLRIKDSNDVINSYLKHWMNTELFLGAS